MRLDVKALAITCGVLWGGAVLLVALANLAWPMYGDQFLRLVASIYPGYDAARSIGGVAIATLYALLDGAVGGAVLGWLYNALAARSRA